MTRQDALTRLRKELVSFYKDPPPLICVSPNEKNMIDWDYLLQGPAGTPYEGGEYHGRLKFPVDYPMAPPEIVMFTPNGRFHPNTALCLSMSNFHPESWNPAWSVSTILKGLLSFMCDEAPTQGAITPPPSVEERKALALNSKKANLASATYRARFPDGFIGKEADEPPPAETPPAAAATEGAAQPSPAPEDPVEPAPAKQQPPAQQTLDASAPRKEVAVGARVTITGLSARADLNGTSGSVTAASAGGRWEVKLDATDE
eukprot:gene8876-13759_t